MPDPNALVACHCCGLIQSVPDLGTRQVARCDRCLTVVAREERRPVSNVRAAAFALAGLIFYFPAILMPILAIERLGHHYESSILIGCLDLMVRGELFVGCVIFGFSIVLPLAKLVLMLILCANLWLGPRTRAATYRWMEHLGRWGMLDVLLVALLVALVKLGDLVTFHIGPAVWAFGLCVISSMLASALFQPHATWEHSP